MTSVALIALLAFIWATFEWLAPGISDGAAFALSFYSGCLLLGSTAEYCGMKARVLYVPFWYLGAVGVCFEISTFLNSFGLAAAILLFISLSAVLVISVRLQKKRPWQSAPRQIALSQQARLQGQPDKAWEHVGSAFNSSTNESYTPLQGELNQKTLSELLELLPPSCPAAEVICIRRIREDFRQGIATMQVFQVAQKKTEWVHEFLKAHGETEEVLPGSVGLALIKSSSVPTGRLRITEKAV